MSKNRLIFRILGPVSLADKLFVTAGYAGCSMVAGDGAAGATWAAHFSWHSGRPWNPPNPRDSAAKARLTSVN